MNLSKDQILEAINLLKNADGEDLQYILEKVGMGNQMLKQLVVISSDFELSNVLEEKEVLKNVANKVWVDIFNNNTLIYNDFEGYWNDFIKN
jgi:hypothetical protein